LLFEANKKVSNFNFCKNFELLDEDELKQFDFNLLSRGFFCNYE
jgi:hypothetical protein